MQQQPECEERLVDFAAAVVADERPVQRRFIVQDKAAVVVE